MTTVERATSELEESGTDDTWWTELADDGPRGQLALARLHELLLRASRHQVWRLRDQLPGADADAIDDLAQQAADDAMVAVLRKIPTFEGRSRFTTWAYKFAILQAGVAVRGQAWRNREVPLPDAFPVADVAPSPAEVSEAAQLARAVEQAITTDLTPHQRRVVLALVVEEVPIDVLAERLGTTRNALYKALHDARQRLRHVLAESGHLESPRRTS